MTQLSANRGVSMKGKYGEIISLRVKTNVHIYKGAMVAVDATGYALPASDTSGHVFEGIAIKEADNTGGANGAIEVLIRRGGLFTMACAGADATWVSKTVYIVDDQTVALVATTTHDICAGQCIRYVSATQVWVDILPRYATPDMSDLAAHVLDTTSAHNALGIDFDDDEGRATAGFTAETEVDGALNQIYASLMTTLGILPLPFGAMTLEDGTALTKYATGGATPGFQQLANKEVVLSWDGNATHTAVAVNFSLPAELDGTADVVVWWDICMAGAVDTPVLEHECYFGKGDTDCAGADDEVDGGVTLTRYSATIANADVPDSIVAGSNLTVIFKPKNGEMTTDELYVYGMGLNYTKKLQAES